MSALEGNPLATEAERYIGEASQIHAWEIEERAIIAANAQAIATLALAYEQRTANLLHALEISLRAQSAVLRVTTEVIAERLGLNKKED